MTPQTATPTWTPLPLKRAFVHFVYSFAWHADRHRLGLTPAPADNIENGGAATTNRVLGLETELVAKGWKKTALHKRDTDCYGEKPFASYRPALETGAEACLTLQSSAPACAQLLAQTGRSESGEDQYTPFEVSLTYAVRLFHNGAGTCTVVVSVNETNATFEHIHHIFRLAQSLSGETDGVKEHFVDAYLRLDSETPSWATSVAPIASVNQEKLPLEDLAEGVLGRQVSLFPDDWANMLICADFNPNIGSSRPRICCQSPFVFTLLETHEVAYCAWLVEVNPLRSKELGSLICKMNLDNTRVLADFSHLSDDYLRGSYPIDQQTGRLKNLSHDDRLFFSFTRRGALALTADIYGMPSFFVLPSLLNLIEIVRARWHLGTILNLGLDKAIASLVGGPVDEVRALRDSILWRSMFAMFLQDPVPYLFDGGAVTEVAEIAEQNLWLTKLRDDAQRKVEVLNRLLNDKQLLGTYSEVRRLDKKPLDEEVAELLGELQDELPQSRS